MPVGVQFHDGGGSFLDRSPRDVELRPIEFGAQSPRKRDFIGDHLTIDIVVVAGTGADTQQPVLPDLDQALRRRVQADHQWLFQ